jgi:hypothetical protein
MQRRILIHIISSTTTIKELQKNSHIGHCTCTTDSANVKVQNVFHGQNNITCSTNCKYRTAGTPYTLEMWFVSDL